MNKTTEAVPSYNSNDIETHRPRKNISYFHNKCWSLFSQRLISIKVFVIYVSLANIFVHSLDHYLGSQITAIEKQFNLQSKSSGILISINDVGFICSVLVLGYLLKNCHRPRVLAITNVTVGLAILICALPYFITPHPKWNTNQNNNGANRTMWTDFKSTQDPALNTSIECNLMEEESFTGSSTIGYFFIFIGMLLIGVGKAARFPLAIAYIDENVDEAHTGGYVGILNGMNCFGPVVVFCLGGYFSKQYVTLEKTSLKPSDPQWIGAWWLGFLTFGFAAILMSVPLFLFPRKLKENENVPEKKKTLSFKDMIQTFYNMAKNPLLILILGHIGLIIFSASGTLPFIPKYFETQFKWTSWKTNIVVSTTFVLMSSIGMIVGGVITSFYKMDLRKCLKFSMVLVTFDLFLVWIPIFIHCPQTELEVTDFLQRYADSPTPVTLQQDLNQLSCFQISSLKLQCNEHDYEPVCGADGRSFKSPCYAGCQYHNIKTNTFSNCSCVGKTQMAKPGICSNTCYGGIYLALVLSIRAFISCISFSSVITALIKCVGESDKAVPFSIFIFTSTLIGWIPAPPLFGMLVDNTCIKWGLLPCRDTGACMMYNLDEFRLRFFILLTIIQVVSFLFLVVATIVGHKSKRYISLTVSTATETAEDNIL
ncbi:solute carrier organic anion transporter family member 74D-like isoform X3 [Octopus sinensis]|nr:solute carrier organic anion transporter family member 74D-like isoform X3 [Octopus sinensis]